MQSPVPYSPESHRPLLRHGSHFWLQVSPKYTSKQSLQSGVAYPFLHTHSINLLWISHLGKRTCRHMRERRLRRRHIHRLHVHDTISDSIHSSLDNLFRHSIKTRSIHLCKNPTRTGILLCLDKDIHFRIRGIRHSARGTHRTLLMQSRPNSLDIKFQ